MIVSIVLMMMMMMNDFLLYLYLLSSSDSDFLLPSYCSSSELHVEAKRDGRFRCKPVGQIH